VYTANGVSNDVSEISTADLTLTRTLPVGERPWGVAYRAAPRSRLSVIPTRTTRPSPRGRGGRHARVSAAAGAGTVMRLGAPPTAAWAHAGEPLAPQGLAGAWFDDPLALAVIGAAAWLDARGTGRLWARAGMGRRIA